MYIPSPYQENRRDILLESIRARSFGTLITVGPHGPSLSHIPFGVVEAGGDAVLIGHEPSRFTLVSDTARMPLSVGPHG